MSESSAIQFSEVSVRLGAHEALNKTSFAIPFGAQVAIVGPNGGGKTTLLKVLLGLIEPTSGEVRLLGKTPREHATGELGYVPQLKTLDRSFPARAEELVATGLQARWPMRIGREDKRRVDRALDRVGALGLARRSLKNLSGGEIQRIYLARSFVREPRVILLDEPATGMDAAGQTDMHHLLEEYRRETNCTVLMVTHDWGAAYYHASHVLMLNRRVVGFGDPCETLTDDSLRKVFGHIGHTHAMAFTPKEREGSDRNASGSSNSRPTQNSSEAMAPGCGCGAHADNDQSKNSPKEEEGSAS